MQYKLSSLRSPLSVSVLLQPRVLIFIFSINIQPNGSINFLLSDSIVCFCATTNHIIFFSYFQLYGQVTELYKPPFIRFPLFLCCYCTTRRYFHIFKCSSMWPCKILLSKSLFFLWNGPSLHFFFFYSVLRIFYLFIMNFIVFFPIRKLEFLENFLNCKIEIKDLVTMLKEGWCEESLRTMQFLCLF